MNRVQFCPRYGDRPAEAAARSSRQSLQRVVVPGGYSKSTAPAGWKPSRRQIAFEGALSTDG